MAHFVVKEMFFVTMCTGKWKAFKGRNCNGQRYVDRCLYIMMFEVWRIFVWIMNGTQQYA